MSNCLACGLAGGLHKPGCPVASGAMQPGNGVATPPKLIPSDLICPVCGYNPPTVDDPKAGGKPITETVNVLVVDGKATVHCARCWNDFVREHSPELVKKGEVPSGDRSPES